MLDELSTLGAMESTWGFACATELFHPIERLPRHVELPCGQRVRVADDGADLFRNRRDSGRPRGVLSAFRWEGRGSAAAVRQTKRREKEWRRSQ